MTPGRLDLRAYRWTPFIYVIDIEGYDLSAASFAAEVRSYRDAPGSALISLFTQANPAAQGISVSVATIDSVTVSSVQIRINETTLESLLPLSSSGLPTDAPDVPLVWDLHIDPVGGDKQRWLEGKFEIVAGSTH